MATARKRGRFTVMKCSTSPEPAPKAAGNALCVICSKRSGQSALTCTICGRQHHISCLSIKTSLVENPNSWFHRDWTCTACARCYCCRKQKVRSSMETHSLIKTFIELIGTKTNSAVTCNMCGATIHAFCLYRTKREKKRGEMNPREFEAEMANHTCQICRTGMDPYLQEEGDDDDDDDEEEEDMEKSPSELSDFEDEDNALRQQQKLKNHLKKLGVMNVEEHLKNSLNQERTLRRSMSGKRSLSNIIVHDDHSPMLKQSILKKRNRRKQSDEDEDVLIQSKKKLFKSKSKVKFEDAEDEEESEHVVQNKKRCSVTDCNSEGHLSGQFQTHRNLETCPLFHNQTVEQCVDRFKQISVGSPNKPKSPSKNRKTGNSPNKGQPLEENPAWARITESRRNEFSANNNFNNTVITSFTSNRQPNLEKFTPSFDLEMFRQAELRNAELIHLNSALELASDNSNDQDETSSDEDLSPPSAETTLVKGIIFGKHQIDVWYTSPYSDDFQNCLKLYICEYCLKCMNLQVVYHRHVSKCTRRYPPGDEIYRKGDISFFEIDGNKQKEYCQNLCMMAKLFLEHKTLLFDVETFLFYIMTVTDSEGMHFVGYFSKEKYSVQGYNVSCILTLPHYQRSGFGRMLIDFSYLLTKTENKFGSPEKPLSDLGLLSYRSYWKFIIKDYLSTYTKKEINIKEMSIATGVSPTDLITTLQLMTIIKYWKGSHIIILDQETRNRFVVDVKQKKKRYGDRMIDPKCLDWVPNSWLTVRPKPTS